ncbi:hypothetical protein [Pontibacter sp. G13]|uniref:hypothetical protein n=1 Tax=Pontibacter sp. G13 TaxID=3074898 RepID=UPI00288B87D9|nr:hypothetical protein [Pontibacter sp. G13]WNJ17476.1 hypothetical protein RJD25_21725 [Pontibacter sp. G13]
MKTHTQLFCLLLILCAGCGIKAKLDKKSNVPTLNLREYPSTASEVVGAVQRGDRKSKVVDRSLHPERLYISRDSFITDYWYRLQSNRHDGWAFGAYLKGVDPDEVLPRGYLTGFADTLQYNSTRPKRTRTAQKNYETTDLTDWQTEEIDLPSREIDLIGKTGKSGVLGFDFERNHGRIVRALRFKPITDAVEDRYNLPPGMLMAMLVQESNGIPFLTNASDDGGAGMIHMQPSTASAFGLEILDDNEQLRDFDHGAKLRKLTESLSEDPYLLMEMDDRFHILLNIDAAGRMLAHYMSKGANPSYGGPLRSAIARYAGRTNYQNYYKRLQEFMTQLYSREFLTQVEEQFNRDHSNSQLSLGAYHTAWWEALEQAFDLAAYRELEAYEPENSEAVMRTFYRYLVPQKP